MILLLDIGNTRVKWARWQEGSLSVGEPALYRGELPDSVWSALWGMQPLPRRVVVASVAGAEIDASLAAWCRARWGISPEFVSAAIEACGVRNGYRHPAQLGVDRWLALIGAHHLQDFSAQHLCVVGCGTALTVDVLTADGHHLGGWIAPGLTLMRQQLEVGAAAFTLGIAPAAGITGFGHETAEAVTAGTQRAAAGLVMQALPLAHDLLGSPPVCVLTGGDAATLLPLLQSAAHVVPDLVLHGLLTLVLQQGATG